MGWQSDRIVNTRTCIHKTLYKFQARESQFFILDRTEQCILGWLVPDPGNQPKQEKI